MISSRFAICAAAAAVALSLSACSTVDLDKDKAGSITDGTSVEEALSSKTGPLANREVHFDFDSYTVSPDQMPVVTNHAQFLAAHRTRTFVWKATPTNAADVNTTWLLVRRELEAVKERMTLLGVSPQQIETISYGKEKPKAEGHDEAAYYENRRVDIHYMLNK